MPPTKEQRLERKLEKFEKMRNKTVWVDRKDVKKIVKRELSKSIDNKEYHVHSSFNTSLSTAATPVLLTNVTAFDDTTHDYPDSSRMDSEIQPKKLQVRMLLAPNGSSSQNMVRYIIVRCKFPTVSGGVAGDTLPDLMEIINGSPHGIANDTYFNLIDYYNELNRSKYKVLYDSGALSLSDNFDYTVKKHTFTNKNSDVTQSLIWDENGRVTNHIWAIVFSADATNPVNVRLASRLIFEDA